MKLYRFSPVRDEASLLQAIRYIHAACHRLCLDSFGRIFDNSGNLGFFCHYEDEYKLLVGLREKLTEPSDNPKQKYYKLHQPIVIEADGAIPRGIYTHLYIRTPDPYRHHVGDLDFYLPSKEYEKIKKSISDGAIIQGARIFPRPDLDMIELYHPDVDVLGYVSTSKMVETVHIKQT